MKSAALAVALLLLSSAPLLAAESSAVKTAPVDYVRVCSVHGAGFFYIPGSDTCIKLSGRVRAEFEYREPATGLDTAGRNIDATGFLSNGRLNLDIRTVTDWGLLRAFARFDFYQSSGVFASGGYGATWNGSYLERAFVQFGGFTAGRVTSFFDFYGNELNWTSIAGSDNTVQLFAYTASFGDGFSATLSVEDRAERQWGPTGVYPDLVYLSAQNIVLPWYGTYPLGTGGTRMPDVVAALRVDQSWGSAQLSGALHEIRYPAGDYIWGMVDGPRAPVPTLGRTNTFLDSDYGYAVQAGLQVNLPWLAQGDSLYLQAAYARGAVSYLGVGNVATSFGQVGPWVFASDAAVFPTAPVLDGFGTTYDGAFTAKPTTGYALTAALLHYWTPSLRQGLFGSLLSIGNPSAEVVDNSLYYTGETYKYGPNDVKVWQAGTNLTWSPVPGLDIGAEIGYINVDNGKTVTRLVADPINGSVAPVIENSQDRFYTRLRVQRDF